MTSRHWPPRAPFLSCVHQLNKPPLAPTELPSSLALHSSRFDKHIAIVIPDFKLAYHRYKSTPDTYSAFQKNLQASNPSSPSTQPRKAEAAHTHTIATSNRRVDLLAHCIIFKLLSLLIFYLYLIIYHI
jgi:hypothetical protein